MLSRSSTRSTWHAAAAATLTVLAAQAGAVTVAGTSNPKLAGMPDGTTTSGDTAPQHSPALAVSSGLVAGSSLTFSVSVISPVGNCAGCTSPTPDGGTGFSNSAQNGISGINSAPINALLGVFLGPDQPSLTAAPASLSFGSAASKDFLSLSPELKQVFFIGDGMTSAAAVQSFVVPTGATRLYLATHDGFGWYNNVGAYEVVVNGLSQPPIPEPQTYALMLAGLAGIGAMVRRRRSD